jgi:hypothetical protein
VVAAEVWRPDDRNGKQGTEVNLIPWHERVFHRQLCQLPSPFSMPLPTKDPVAFRGVPSLGAEKKKALTMTFTQKQVEAMFARQATLREQGSSQCPLEIDFDDNVRARAPPHRDTKLELLPHRKYTSETSRRPLAVSKRMVLARSASGARLSRNPSPPFPSLAMSLENSTSNVTLIRTSPTTSARRLKPRMPSATREPSSDSKTRLS